MFRESLRAMILRCVTGLGVRRWAIRHRHLLDGLYFGFFHFLDRLTGRRYESDPTPQTPKGEACPRVSMILLSYQHGDYIAEALSSAFAQDYQNMEILISDDHSTDDSAAIIGTMIDAYNGPHDVNFTVNPENYNIRHLNYAIPKTSGDIIVLATSDDVMRPHRVRRLVDELIATDTSLVGSNAIVTNDEGKPMGLFYPKGKVPTLGMRDLVETLHVFPVFAASIAFRRDVWERFGALLPGPREIDVILPFRALLLKGLSYVPEPLLEHRWHDRNDSVSRLHRFATSDSELRGHHAAIDRNHLVTVDVMRATLHQFVASGGVIAEYREEELDTMLSSTAKRIRKRLKESAVS